MMDDSAEKTPKNSSEFIIVFFSTVYVHHMIVIVNAKDVLGGIPVT